MKKTILSIILFFVVLTSTYTQCNNDATAKKYKSKVDKGLNVQACSQCATLALYLCSASLSTKPEHVKELSSMIAQLKNNIRELAPNNCCPELLVKSPHFGSKVNGTTSKDIFTNTKSSNSDKSSNGIHKDDLKELGNAFVSGISLTAMLMDEIDKILPDVSPVYKEAAKQFKYSYEESNGNGNGKGTIMFADKDYIFKGKIKNGFPKEGKMQIGLYGKYEGKFNTYLASNLGISEQEISGGNPYNGKWEFNFGINHNSIYTNNNFDFSYSLENGDKITITKSGLKRFFEYYSLRNNKSYTTKFRNIKTQDFKKLKKDIPINNPEIKENLVRYYMATAVKIMTLPKMLGRNMSNWWWQKLLDNYVEGMLEFSKGGKPNLELDFWKEKILEDTEFN